MKKLPFLYLPWLLKDMARGPLAVLAGFLCLAAVFPKIQGAPPELVWKAFPYMLETACFLATLVLTRSLVNRDLRRGYYRIYFSRPVHPAAFYLLRWALGLAALLLFAGLFTGIVMWKYALALPFPHYAPYIALQYLVLGGLIALLSVFLPEDAGAALVLCAFGAYHYSNPEPGLFFRLFGWALPPLYLCRASTGGQYGAQHWLALLYGCAAAAAAGAALHFKYFGEGGRGD